MAEVKQTKKTRQAVDVYDFKANLLLNNGININTRSLLISEDISNGTYKRIVKYCDLLKTLNNEPIRIYLTTSGGCVFSMLAIMDYLQQLTCVLETYAVGEVASAGICIYACGDLRYSGQFTKFMIHPLSYSASFGKIHDHKAEMELTRDIERQTNMFMSKRTKKNFQWWNEAGKRADLHINAEKALDIGLVQEIQASRPNLVDPHEDE